MISAIVLTKDSENILDRCLQSLNWSDEIIIIDDNSTDKTLGIAQKHKAKIFQRSLDNDFAAQRNFGLDKAKGEWVLFIDSDEEVSDKLKEEIISKLKSSENVEGYLLKRHDYYQGTWLTHGEVGDQKLLRLAKKDAGIWKRKVHEIWDIKGTVESLQNPIFHYPHPTIKDFLKEINTYSTLHAGVAYEEGQRTNFFLIVLKPKMKFLQNYILRGGFLDGSAGFIYAMMMGFHSFLTQAKLWQLQKKTNS